MNQIAEAARSLRRILFRGIRLKKSQHLTHDSVKCVYLTIDDSPSRDFIKKVDFLKSRNIPAILFCKGKLMEENPTAVEYAIPRGFIIGNHGYSHRQFSTLTFQQGREEILKADALIVARYQAANVRLPMKVFRFPFGDRGGSLQTRLQKVLRELGYKQPGFEGINYAPFHDLGFARGADCYWTVDIKEWKYRDLEYLKQRLNTTIANKDDIGNLYDCTSSDIILIHDHGDTTDLFFDVMDFLTTMKLRFLLPEAN